jgi:hypothetical protein
MTEQTKTVEPEDPTREIDGIVPAAEGWHAIFEGDEGNRYEMPLACWGLLWTGAVVGMVQAIGNAELVTVLQNDDPFVDYVYAPLITVTVGEGGAA